MNNPLSPFNIKLSNFWLIGSYILIFCLNLILKISYLDSEPFWYDEIVSTKAALLDFGHIKHISEWDNNPPFYYYCIWVWVKLFGVSEFKVRLLNVVFSALSACLVFSLLRNRFNTLAAFAASLIFTFHAFNYEYSHEARCYSLVVLLVLASSWFFLSFIEKNKITSLIFLGLFNFLIVYTHYIAGIILLFQITILFIHYRDLIKRYSISLGICALLVFLRFTKKQFLVMFAFNSDGKSFWLEKANLARLKEVVFQLFGGPTVAFLLLLVFTISVIFLVIKWRALDKPKKAFHAYVLLSGIGSLGLLFIIGLYKPLFLGRYLLFTTPFLIITTIWILTTTNKYLLLLVPVLVFFQAYTLNLNPQKTMDFRTAAEVTKNLVSRNNSMVILQTRDITALFAYYYNKAYFMDHKNLQNNLQKERIYEIETSADLQNIPFQGENSIVFCQSFDKASDNTRIFDIFKQNNFVFTTTKTIRGVKISTLRKVK